jgi:hypothetical protein
MRHRGHLPFLVGLRVSFTILLMGAALGPPRHGLMAAPHDALAARLGGTRQSFDEHFGSPHRRGLDWAYDLPGYGLVLVQFGGESGDSPALVITLRSRRPDDLPATTPHPADWTLEQAEARAQTFLPADARLGARTRLAADTIMQPCASDALIQAFGAVGTRDHACQVTYVTPTHNTVSFVTVGLASQATIGPLATPEDPCKGISEWTGATSHRLEDAERLLREVGTLAGDTSETISRLRELADRFRALADEQRSSPAPTQMATANFHLIAGFEAYASGLSSAADALEQHDDAGIDNASSALVQAGQSIAQANQAMTEGFAACGLTAGTPAPSS